jgi:hypothetical protein
VDETGDAVIPPRLREILASLDLSARRAVTELIGVHVEFPAWAVRAPGRDAEWLAVRSASDRAPDAGLPLVWATAATAEELADRMHRIDTQLDKGQ